MPESKYERIEWERRFLLDHFPANLPVTRVRRITDRYIDGTNLRLRQLQDDDSGAVFKLTQKRVHNPAGSRQGFITSIFLSQDEFGVVAQLPAKVLNKTRYSVPPFGIDVFEGTLAGLVLAEVEFHSAEDAAAFVPPAPFTREVSTDIRFTGGYLVAASRLELSDFLAGFGIKLEQV